MTDLTAAPRGITQPLAARPAAPAATNPRRVYIQMAHECRQRTPEPVCLVAHRAREWAAMALAKAALR